MSESTSARPRGGRSVFVLGTCCGTLAVAAVVSAVHPASEPASLPRADSAPAAQWEKHWDEQWEDVDESAPVGGPLEIPTIGEVPDDYDERYAALDAARAAEAARAASAQPSEPAGPPPPTPESPAEAPPPAPPVTPPVEAPPVEASPVETPAVEPAGSPPAAGEVPVPTEPVPSAPPLPAEESPAEEPPAEESPPVEAPAEPELIPGEQPDHLDADDTVPFSRTLVRVDGDLVCTAPGSVPAENGHLIALHFEVAPTEAEVPALDAADFRFLDGDGVLTDDVDTDSAAACLTETDPPGEHAGIQTVVLDVPALTGTLVHRSESWPTGLR